MTDRREDRNALLAEIEELFIQFSDGDASPADQHRLAELLRTSDVAREHYVRLANLRVGLHWRMRIANDEMFAGIENCFASPEADSSRRRTTDMPAANLLGRLAQRLPRAIDYRTHPWRFGGTALVITLLLWGAFFTYMWPWIQQRPTAPAQFSPVVVAEIVDTFAAEFEGIAPDRFVLTGGQLRLRSGTMVLRYRSGATVVLQGPADFVVAGADFGELHSGRLTARLGAPQQQFEVATPTAVVRDRGTEFGVFVSDVGESHVHVFQGRVDVTERDAAGDSRAASTRRLVAGESLVVSRVGVVAVPVDAAQFQRTAHLPIAYDELKRVDNVLYRLPIDPLAFPSDSSSTLYPDDGVKLTDGRVGGVDPGDRRWVGWNDGVDASSPDSGTPQPRIEFDLRESQFISGIEIYYLVFTGSAVHSPNRVVATFADDADFTQGVSTVTYSNFSEQLSEQSVRRALIRFPARRARYARLDFYCDKQWLFLSEVRFLRADEPKQPTNSPPSPTPVPTESL